MGIFRKWAARPTVGFGLAFLLVLWGGVERYFGRAASFRSEAVLSAWPEAFGAILLALLALWALARLLLLPMTTGKGMRLRLFVSSLAIFLLALGLLLDMGLGREVYVPAERDATLALGEGYHDYQLQIEGDQVRLATPDQIVWEGSLTKGLRAGATTVASVPMAAQPTLVVKSGPGRPVLIAALALLLCTFVMYIPRLWRIRNMGRGYSRN